MLIVFFYLAGDRMLGVAALLISYTSQYYLIDAAISYPYAAVVNTTRDDSITRYVGPDDILNDVRYKPADLVDITKPDEVLVQGGVGHLRKEAFDQLVSMAEAFSGVFKKPLVVVSAYRSYGLQVGLFGSYRESYGVSAFGFSALPGHSEHQLGLAVDLFTANSQSAGGYKGYYDWLQKNAYKWGRAQSYQNGAAIDGYVVEPWHRRYVGVPLAALLHFKRMTFSEWLHKYKLVHSVQIIVK